jgi:hypothetical protein
MFLVLCCLEILFITICFLTSFKQFLNTVQKQRCKSLKPCWGALGYSLYILIVFIYDSKVLIRARLN